MIEVLARAQYLQGMVAEFGVWRFFINTGLYFTELSLKFSKLKRNGATIQGRGVTAKN